ncbi:MAG: winged helix-turn-helix domain-containing protein [Halobacteriales archaeon]
MAQATQEEIEDMPPSAKLVLKVLEYKGALTQKEIIEESMLSARTVRYALERLEEIGVVEEDFYFADARQNLYEVTDVPGQQVEADGGAEADASDEACCGD